MWRGNFGVKDTSKTVEKGTLGLRDSRASFELRDEDVESVRSSRSGSFRSGFHRGTCTTVPELLAAFSYQAAVSAPQRPMPAVPAEDTEEVKLWQKQHPNILGSFSDFVTLLEGKRLVMFLDYDGTLAPIVSNPDLAYMTEEMRAEVRSLAQMFPTAIISGRGREKVEHFVQLAELYYAGSHGMDIASPKVSNGAVVVDGTFQPAAKFKPLIDQVYHELTAGLADIAGAFVEHNVFCVSAHFRNCDGEAWRGVVSVVESVVARHGDQLRITHGRKVVEVRPSVDWHKGTALRHLLEVLRLHGQPDVVALYIGDDKTDEDAFKELKESNMGLGILVTTKVKPTAAGYTVRDPCEVQELLSRLVSWGSTSGNGWLAPPGG